MGYLHDNVIDCAHPRICQAQEAYLPWDEMSALLDALDDACQNFKIDELRALLLSAPYGYASTESEVNDLLWLHR